MEKIIDDIQTPSSTKRNYTQTVMDTRLDVRYILIIRLIYRWKWSMFLSTFADIKLY